MNRRLGITFGLVAAGAVAAAGVTYLYSEHEEQSNRAANCSLARDEVRQQAELKPAAATSPRLAVLGDSYTAGRGADSVSTGYAYETGESLQMPTASFGFAGSGVVAEGSCGDGRFSRRVAEVVEWKPDTLIVQTGLNDRTASASELEDAMSTLLAELRSGLPNTRIVVLGPVDPNGGDESLSAVPPAFSAAAAENHVQFVDPIAESWLTEENRDKFVGPDHLHLTQAGHDYLASRLAAALRPS